MVGSGYREPPSLARAPADGQIFQLTPLLYLVLAAVDGRRSYDEIAEQVSARLRHGPSRPTTSARSSTSSCARLACSTKRRRQPARGEEVQPAAGAAVQVRRQRPRPHPPDHRAVRPRCSTPSGGARAARRSWSSAGGCCSSRASPPRRTRRSTSPGCCCWSSRSPCSRPASTSSATRPRRAAAGPCPGVMGAGIYLVWPAFYTDVTDSYRLGRAGRVRTDLGGLYFNAIVAVAVIGVWWATQYDALLLVVATQILQMVQQLTPLVRFDGYHVLADVTGVPDLFHRIKPTLLGMLPWRWRDPRGDGAQAVGAGRGLAVGGRRRPDAGVLAVHDGGHAPPDRRHRCGQRRAQSAPPRARLGRRRLPRGGRPRHRHRGGGLPGARDRGDPLPARPLGGREDPAPHEGKPVQRGLSGLLAPALVAGLALPVVAATPAVPPDPGLGGRHPHPGGAGTAPRAVGPSRRRCSAARSSPDGATRTPVRPPTSPVLAAGAGAQGAGHRVRDRPRAAPARDGGTAGPARPTPRPLGLPVQQAARPRQGRQPGVGGQHRPTTRSGTTWRSRWSGSTTTPPR